ncbi:dihydrofolate reductase [Rubrolithibacter danxiaensis]|uniref:dihydrofolate reductase n=1 Tax=Rubrolithibacter danxiaensis TaxID=3390805 RepID=UPI003BF8F5F9
MIYPHKLLTHEPDNPMTKEISHVVIADENNGIGKDNQLLCHLPADLKHFKDLTIGFPVVMGRKTFDSIQKPLIKRRNIVISRQEMQIPGCEVVHSIEEALQKCETEEKVSIVGGATIYRQSLDVINTIYLTRIHHTFEADTFYPELNPDDWEEKEKEYHEADEKNPFAYTFITYKKRF